MSPPSTMLASWGAGISRQTRCISTSLRGASTKTMSAPRSANARPRQIASSSPIGARASVRASISRSAPCSRASTAARTRASASSRATTLLAARVAAALGRELVLDHHAREAGAPRSRRRSGARSSDCRIRCRRLRSPGSRPRRRCCAPARPSRRRRSSPVSGSARRAAETAKPLMKVSSKPARSTSFAESASKQQGITRSPGRASRLPQLRRGRRLPSRMPLPRGGASILRPSPAAAQRASERA